MSEPAVSFSLLDEPWIPVVTNDGEFVEVSLLALFTRSSDLRAVWSDSSLETLALHRVMIAVMLAALTAPETPGGWRRDLTARAIDEIDERGLPVARIVEYLRRWRDRFWLFGPEAFWQLGSADVSPVARLDPLRAVGTQPAFFDHHQDLRPAPLACAAAARALLVGQVFAVGVGRGPGGRAFRNGLIGKLALVALPFGATVRSTLEANLIAYEVDRQPQDAPVWERERELRMRRIDVSEHVPDGLLDMLTWESRAVELHRSEGQGVARAGFAMGVNAARFEELVQRRRIDPWVPVRRTRSSGLQAVRGDVGPAAWRDSYAIVLGLLRREELAEAPSVLGAARARSAGRHALALLVGGLIAEGKNTFAGALLSRVPLPPESLNEMPASFVVGLEQVVGDARAGASAAEGALCRFARECHATDPRQAARVGREAWEREQSAYWASGGRAFSAHVARLAAGEELAGVRASWLDVVRGGAMLAVRRATEPFTDARGLRAGALAGAHLRRHLPRVDMQGGSVTSDERRAQASAFATRLWSTLEHDRGASVELRRLLAPAPVPTRAYWQLNPPGRIWPCELPMWLAGLAASRPRSMARPGAEPELPELPERPGQALRRARDRIAREGRGSVTAFERQVSELLTCHPEDLWRELPPVVELATRIGVRFDYGVLLFDLSRWDDQARFVQRAWAEDLWAPRTEQDVAPAEKTRWKETTA